MLRRKSGLAHECVHQSWLANKPRVSPRPIHLSSALLRTISRRNKRCWAPSWSTTRRSTASPTSWSRRISSSRSISKIFELAASLIRAGKVASPVTLKTFLPPDLDVGGLTASQYLARLAAEATTVINAEDYGRTIYDLAIRRTLIIIGEDMVNVAYDAPVDLAPQRPDRGRRAAALRAGRDRPLRRRLPALRDRADHRGRHGGARLSARRQAVGPRDRPDATSTA